MEIDDLKLAWDKAPMPEKTAEEIKLMLSENRHPVLKGIRKQAAIEIAGWFVFLLCYYTMFDGGNKPLWLNMILVSAVLWPLIHNLMGYRFEKYLVKGNNIRESLINYLANVKVYAWVSIISRVLFAVGLLLFFTYGIKFNAAKYLSLAIIVLLFIVQLALLGNLWVKRLNKLQTTLADFKA